MWWAVVEIAAEEGGMKVASGSDKLSYGYGYA